MASLSYDTFQKEKQTKSSPVSYSNFQTEKSKKKSTVGYSKFQEEKLNPPKSFGQKVIEPVKKYVTDFTGSVNQQTAERIGDAIIHPWDTATKVSDTFKKAYIGGIDKAGAGLKKFINGKGFAESASGLLDTGTGIINAVFSPITGFFEVANKIPGAKQVADFAALPVTVPAKVTDYGVGKAIDSVPESVMSQETKDIIKQPLQEFSSSIAGIYFGGKIMKAIESKASKGQKLTKEEAKKLVVQFKEEANNIPIKTPKTKQAEYAKSQGYEPYIPTSQLPVIPFGKRGNETIPTVDYVTNKIVKPSVAKGEVAPTYENFVKEAQQKAPVISEPTLNVKTEPVNIKTEPIKVGQESKPTQLTETLKTDAFAKGIEADFGKSPEYQTMNMKEQKAKADNIIKNSPEFAKNIIEGNVAPPEGVKLGSVYTAMKLDALEKGDVAKILELSKSKANETASAYGQEVKAFDSQLANDPVKIINDIQKARETASEKRTQTTVSKAQEKIVGEIKQEIKMKKPTKEDWASFIRDIQCP